MLIKCMHQIIGRPKLILLVSAETETRAEISQSISTITRKSATQFRPKPKPKLCFSRTEIKQNAKNAN